MMHNVHLPLSSHHSKQFSTFNSSQYIVSYYTMVVIIATKTTIFLPFDVMNSYDAMHGLS